MLVGDDYLGSAADIDIGIFPKGDIKRIGIGHLHADSVFRGVALTGTNRPGRRFA